MLEPMHSRSKINKHEFCKLEFYATHHFLYFVKVSPSEFVSFLKMSHTPNYLLVKKIAITNFPACVCDHLQIFVHTFHLNYRILV